MTWQARLIVPVLLVVMGGLYALAMFGGLEALSGYHGSTYQALHPGSFPNDAFMSPTRPSMLSLYYVLIRWVGEAWLDDRVTTAVYAALVILALAGVDALARRLGAVRIGERLAVLSLMLLGHKILDNQGWLLGHADFNATQLSSPLVIWLLCHALSGPRLRVAVPLMTLIVALSVKNSWLPCLVTLAVLWRERLSLRGRQVAAVAALGAAAAGVVAYVLWFRASTDVALFDYILRELDNAEANPFLNPLAANLVFVALCVAAFYAKGLPEAVMARARLAIQLGLGLWLAGGLYLSFAPDWMKVPYVVPFDVTRGLWWIQYLVYVVLSVSWLKWIQQAPSRVGAAAAWVLLMGLYFLHWTVSFKLAAAVAATALAMAGWTWWRRSRGGPGWDAPARLRMAAVAMCVGALSLYGVGLVNRRWEALRFLARHGIMGDNGGALWVEVNPYIRDHTSPSATVLALADRNAIGQPLGLRYEGSLRNRTGRSMPLGSTASFYFDYPNILWTKERRVQVQQLMQAWERQDLSGVVVGLQAMGSPDYLVAPMERSTWLRQRPEFGYDVEAERGGFLIFRQVQRTAQAG